MGKSSMLFSEIHTIYIYIYIYIYIICGQNIDVLNVTTGGQ